MSKMTHDEILNALSECICRADERQDMETGDNLFEIIRALRKEWGMDEEED